LNDIWSPDVLPNALFAWTVVREGNVDYDEFVFRPGLVDPNNRNAPANSGLLDSEAYFFRACGGSTAAAPPQATRSPGGPPGRRPSRHRARALARLPRETCCAVAGTRGGCRAWFRRRGTPDDRDARPVRARRSRTRHHLRDRRSGDRRAPAPRLQRCRLRQPARTGVRDQAVRYVAARRVVWPTDFAESRALRLRAIHPLRVRDDRAPPARP